MLYSPYGYKSSNDRINAQLNLEGRTHYVDTDTLRFHHARINGAFSTAGGFLFCVIESVSTDMNNTRREHRYVVFDITGEVISRPDLGDGYRNGEKARAALRSVLESLDVEAVSRKALERMTDRNNYAAKNLAESIERAASEGRFS